MANFNLNKVILGGRMTADPELKQTPQGIPVVSFTVAVNRRFQSKNSENQENADFIRCEAWRATAEFIARYFRKGSSICVVGAIQTNTWLDQNQQRNYSTRVVVDEANFVDSKNESQASGQAYNPYTPDSAAAPSFSSSEEAPKFEEMSSDDDLPF